MPEELKIGDRFYIFRIVNGDDYPGRFINGTLRIGYPGRLKTLVNVLGSDGIFYFMTNHLEVQKVGELKITKVKV